MRPKIVLGVLAIPALLLFGLSFLLSGNHRPEAQAPSVAAISSSPARPSSQESTPAPVTISKKVTSAVSLQSQRQPSAEEKEALEKASIRNTLGEIETHLAERDDLALGIFLDRLRHPEKQVREAALDAIKQLDDKAAIPRLKELAENTEDPSEKRALLDAIEFVELPLAKLTAKPKARLADPNQVSASKRNSRLGGWVKGRGTSPRSAQEERPPTPGDQPQNQQLQLQQLQQQNQQLRLYIQQLQNQPPSLPQPAPPQGQEPPVESLPRE